MREIEQISFEFSLFAVSVSTKNIPETGMLLKREWGMGNGEWGMWNGECGMGNVEWGMGNGEWEIENGKLKMRNWQFFYINFL